MAFALVGAEITQTGTDTDLSGLIGNGATTLDSSADVDFVTYDLGLNTLVIDGTLSIDPKVECLAIPIAPTGSITPLTLNGTLTIGNKETSGSLVKYSEGNAIIFTGAGGSNTGQRAIETGTSSTLNMYGGIIRTASPINFGNGATVNWESGTIYNTRSSFIQLRISASGSTNNDLVSFTGLTLDGDTDSISIFPNDGFADMQLKIFRGQFQNSVNDQPDITFVNWDNTNSFETDDLLANSNGTNNMTATFQNVGRQISIVERIGNRDAFALTKRDCKINFLDANSDAVTDTVAYYGVDTDNGSRFVGYNGVDLTADQVYSGTTTAGFAEEIILNQVAEFFDGVDQYDDRTNANGNIPISGISYLYNIGTAFPEMIGLQQDVSPLYLITDRSITETVKATVDAYTTIDNAQEFYDRAKSFLVSNYSGEQDTIVDRSENTIDAGTYDVDIDATAGSAFAFSAGKITIKTSDFVGNMTTTGTITLLNGATFTGTRTDTNGTVAPPRPVTATVIAGTRVQLYNVTTATEIVNEVEAGTSYSYIVTPAEGSVGDTIRIRLTQTSGTTGYLPLETSANLTATGIEFLATQEADTIYNTIAQDGSLITKFTADYINTEVDVTVAADFTGHELYAWFAYNLTLEDGIRQFFGGFVAVDIANFKVVTSVVDAYFDNTTTTNIKQTDNVRIYRDDEVYPVNNPTTGGGGIDMVWRDKVFIAETGVSGLTPSESAQLSAINPDLVIINENVQKASLLIPATTDL